MGRADRHPVLEAVSAYLPGQKVPTASIEDKLGLPAGYCLQRTGIRSRYWARPESDPTELAAVPVREMASRGVDYLIVSSDTLDPGHCPLAPRVATAAGLGRIPAVDIDAVCSGYLYGLELAESLVRARKASTVCVVTVELYSRILGGADPGPYMIFGDATTATIVSDGESPGLSLHRTRTGSDGTLQHIIGRHDPLGPPHSELPHRDRDAFRMDGQAVFVEAVRTMSTVLEEICAAEEVRLSEVDLIVPHQANRRIVDRMSARLDIPPEVFVWDGERHGNTGSSSIPLALAGFCEHHSGIDPVTVVAAGFGGGVGYGAAYLSGTTPYASVIREMDDDE